MLWRLSRTDSSCRPSPCLRRLSRRPRPSPSFGLDPDWLNPGPSGLLVHGLPTGFSERLTSRDFGSSLRVSFASRVDQIFFKLYAAADRRELRDFSDLQQLEPTTAELWAAARWARTHNMPGPFDDAMARALADLGVEDEGRRA
jgi:hypothetical protein